MHTKTTNTALTVSRSTYNQRITLSLMVKNGSNARTVSNGNISIARSIMVMRTFSNFSTKVKNLALSTSALTVERESHPTPVLQETSQKIKMIKKMSLCLNHAKIKTTVLQSLTTNLLNQYKRV